MSDTTRESGGTGPSHRGVEIGVAVFMALLALVGIYGSLQVGIGWGAEGPKSGFFPFYLGVLIILSSVMNLVTATTQDPRQIFADWSQLMSVLSVVVPTAIYGVAVPWVGIYAASLVLIAVFMMWLGR